jgi:hypothetical protein
MRYTDEELYEYSAEELRYLKLDTTYNALNKSFVERLKYLIRQSLEKEDWMAPEIKHLRNYREKSIEFLELKII